jgi:hypothetical protein
MSAELRIARYVALCLVVAIAFGALTHALGSNSAVGEARGVPAHPGPANASHLLASAASLQAAQLGPPLPPCRGAADGTILSHGQILSYYGNPYSRDMGILGELDTDKLFAQLEAHSRRYDLLNGPEALQPALHIVQAVAQPLPGPDGLYLQHLDDATLTQYVERACAHGMLVFLDLQIGRSDVRTEVERISPYLSLPNVHLALDPEFAMPPGEAPGQTIGSITGDDINVAQQLLSEVATKTGRDKVLIVHQFLDSMIVRPEALRDVPGVQLVIDMDGFGPADIKEVKYGWFTGRSEHAGIKLFFRHDPDLMNEERVLALQPDVIIYQ